MIFLEIYFSSLKLNNPTAIMILEPPVPPWWTVYRPLLHRTLLPVLSWGERFSRAWTGWLEVFFFLPETNSCASLYCNCSWPGSGPRGTTVWNFLISRCLLHSTSPLRAVFTAQTSNLKKVIWELMVLCFLKPKKLLSAQSSGWINPNCIVRSDHAFFSYINAYLRLINFEQLSTLIIVIWGLDHKA